MTSYLNDDFWLFFVNATSDLNISHDVVTDDVVGTDSLYVMNEHDGD